MIRKLLCDSSKKASPYYLYFPMSKKYKLTDKSKLYFVSFGVTNWIDLFTRNEYRNVSIEKLKSLPERKEFKTLCLVFNYESRPFNNSNKGKCVSNIIINLKRHTSEGLHKAITNNKTESGKEWMI